MPTPQHIQQFDPTQVVIRPGGRMPHWRQEATVYFVTWRLADALPAPIRQQLLNQRAQWLFERLSSEQRNRLMTDSASLATLNVPAAITALPEEQRTEYHKAYTVQINDYLDAGHGQCLLQNPAPRQLVVDALRHFDNERYQLFDFVIMPNHVHLLVRPFDGHELSEVLHSWKSFTGHKLKKLSNSEGPVWMPESYTRIVRSPYAFLQYQKYIAKNPEKAKLSEGSYSLATTPLIDLKAIHAAKNLS